MLFHYILFSILLRLKTLFCYIINKTLMLSPMYCLCKKGKHLVMSDGNLVMNTQSIHLCKLFLLCIFCCDKEAQVLVAPWFGSLALCQLFSLNLHLTIKHPLILRYTNLFCLTWCNFEFLITQWGIICALTWSHMVFAGFHHFFHLTTDKLIFLSSL